MAMLRECVLMAGISFPMCLISMANSDEGELSMHVAKFLPNCVIVCIISSWSVTTWNSQPFRNVIHC